jgi:hypothetical protein
VDPSWRGIDVTPKLRRVITAVVTVLALGGLTVGGTATPVAVGPAETQTAELAGLAATAVGIGCSSSWSCTEVYGGAYLMTTRNSCSAALPVRERSTGRWYVLTAGHCVAKAGGATWRQSGRTLGIGTRWEYGGLGTQGRSGSGDVGLIRITGNTGILKPRSRVLVVGSRGTRAQQIIQAKDARYGERVCVTAGRSNITRCGTVVAPTTSLRYASPGLPARTVSNLALVRGVCLQPGDSGSAVFAGRSAIGIAVAKSGSGCYFWYSKITRALSRYGLAVVS